jgi:phosphonate transport system substrate-binding protein
MSRFFSVIAAALMFASAAFGQQPPVAKSLVFGLITPRSAAETREGWQPFVDRMAIAIRTPMEVRTYAKQGDLVSAFRNGEVDVAWMGNAPALEVVESGSGVVFAQLVTKSAGAGYNSVLVVPKTSKLRSLTDVLQEARSLRFGDGDVNSTSGHLVPYYFAFQKNGIENTSGLFKKVSNNSHQKNMMLIAKGELDVATANTVEMVLFARDFPQLAQQLRVVWESPVIPQSPLLWKVTLPAELKRKILQFTVSYGTSSTEERAVLEKLNDLTGFRKSSNRQLVPVADIEMFKARQAINNDPSVTGVEKARRIDEVIRRSSRLELLLKVSSASPP